jgi:hypothetical protein
LSCRRMGFSSYKFDQASDQVMAVHHFAEAECQVSDDVVGEHDLQLRPAPRELLLHHILEEPAEPRRTGELRTRESSVELISDLSE